MDEAAIKIPVAVAEAAVVVPVPNVVLSVWGQLINYAWVVSYGRVGLLVALNDL